MVTAGPYSWACSGLLFCAVTPHVYFDVYFSFPSEGREIKWRDLAEQQIQKARAEGQLDDLRGSGKPLAPRMAGDVVTAGMNIMAEAGVLPREIQLKKDVAAKRDQLRSETDPNKRRRLMAEQADLEMRLAIEQEARQKFYRTS